MATMKACVQKERRDGFFPVYIRVTHNRTTQYIKTDKMVTRKELTKSKEIKDPFVLQYCTQRILGYNTMLNETDTSNWTSKEIVEFLQNNNHDICFILFLMSLYANFVWKRKLAYGLTSHF